MASTYFEAMRAHGFSYNTTASVRKLQCPRCGFEFSLVYARTFACQGCPMAAMGCDKVRCGKCDNEFPLTQSADIHDRIQQRTLADHITAVVNERNEGLGLVSTSR